jgi:hypothetical protein
MRPSLQDLTCCRAANQQFPESRGKPAHESQTAPGKAAEAPVLQGFSGNKS